MLNDDQYDRKHEINPTAKGIKLAEEHVLISIKSLGVAVSSLIIASNCRLENGSDKLSIIQEKTKLAEYRDASYDLFFVHGKLIKLCCPATLRKVNDLSSNYCTKATARLHVTNL